MTERFVVSNSRGDRKVLDEPQVSKLTSATVGVVTVNTLACEIGDAVYLASNNVVGPAHQDVSSSSTEYQVIGFVQSLNTVITDGNVTVEGWGLTPGAEYWLSDTPGQITLTPYQTNDTGWSVPVGIAITEDTLRIDTQMPIFLG